MDAEPCLTCRHHPGDHKGWEGQPEARCTLCRSCRGYRDSGKIIPGDNRGGQKR